MGPPDNLVNDWRWQWLLVRIRPQWLRHDSFGGVAEELEVVLDGLRDQDALAVTDLGWLCLSLACIILGCALRGFHFVLLFCRLSVLLICSQFIVFGLRFFVSHSTKLSGGHFTEELLQLVCKALVFCIFFCGVFFWPLLCPGFLLLPFLLLVLLLLPLGLNLLGWLLFVLFQGSLLASFAALGLGRLLGLLLGFGGVHLLWSVLSPTLLRPLLPAGKSVVRADFWCFLVALDTG